MKDTQVEPLKYEFTIACESGFIECFSLEQSVEIILQEGSVQFYSDGIYIASGL